MKQWKNRYLITISIIVLISLGIFYYYGHNGRMSTNDIVSGSIALIALIISIISVAQSDKKKILPKLEIKLWHHKVIKGIENTNVHEVNFAIHNLNEKTPFQFNQLLLTFPQKCKHIEGNDNIDTVINGWRETKFGNSIVLKADTEYLSTFIGTNKENRSLTFELRLKLDQMSDRNMYLELYSYDYLPFLRTIKPTQSKELLEEKFTNRENSLTLY